MDPAGNFLGSAFMALIAAVVVSALGASVLLVWIVAVAVFLGFGWLMLTHY